MPKKPFYRSFDDWWYVEVGPRGNRRQVKLVKGKENEQEAYRKFCEHVAFDDVPPSPIKLTIAQACDLFLDWSYHEHESDTYKWYKGFLEDFCRAFGGVRVVSLKPFHITRWLRFHDWNPTTQNRAISCVKRSLNWCLDEGLIKENPIQRVRKPRAKRRERLLSPIERRQILAAVKDKQFKMFLFALGQTGARPKEIRTVTAENIDLESGIWVFEQHKTARKTGKDKVIYLTPPLVRLSKMLMLQNPKGPIFRNTRGRPWTSNAIRLRFRNLRRKLQLGEKVVAYCFRHSYITEALERDVPIATVAELVGHVDTTMIGRHYSHLGKKREYLKNAARKAVKQSGETD